jgi:hypothetical protein
MGPRGREGGKERGSKGAREAGPIASARTLWYIHADAREGRSKVARGIGGRDQQRPRGCSDLPLRLFYNGC